MCALFSILLLLVPYAGPSQFLPVNGSGKCEMGEVVLAEGFSKAALYTNESHWFKSLTAEGKLSAIQHDSVAGKSSATFEFPVYLQSGLLKKMAGSVSYHLAVELKEGKYRYSFGDFVFHYYTQDRNYKLVKTGKIKPLEEPEAPGWQRSWNAHRKATLAMVNRQIAQLKRKIVEVASSKESTQLEEKKLEW